MFDSRCSEQPKNSLSAEIVLFTFIIKFDFVRLKQTFVLNPVASERPGSGSVLELCAGVLLGLQLLCCRCDPADTAAGRGGRPAPPAALTETDTGLGGRLRTGGPADSETATRDSENRSSTLCRCFGADWTAGPDK